MYNTQLLLLQKPANAPKLIGSVYTGHTGDLSYDVANVDLVEVMITDGLPSFDSWYGISDCGKMGFVTEVFESGAYGICTI